MKWFETQGPVNAEDNYVVARTDELADYIKRVKRGRYVVLFAPRQTGKTTFFKAALAALEAAEEGAYLPIHLNFEGYKNLASPEFYGELYEDIREEIGGVFRRRGKVLSDALTQLLESTTLTSPTSMRRFFSRLGELLTPHRFVVIIDEFDGIPQGVLSDFLHTLRHIYLLGRTRRCPYSVGIVGVKSITQLNDGLCEITNPIYLYRILQELQPLINGLEEAYYPPNTDDGYREYLSPTSHIAMARLLDNFRDFIARAGYRILQVPDTQREYVGQYLLFAYLDEFVRQVRGAMHLEVQTGRGRADLVIFHQGRKHIVETKIWQGELSYRAGKEQLSAYLKLEGVPEGYYIVFAHRETPVPRVETETVDGLTIRSYVIPVRQKRPSAPTTEEAS